MIQITNDEFDSTVRSLRKVTIKSALVGHETSSSLSTRLTIYYRGKRAVGLIREYGKVKTYFSNFKENVSCER